MEALELIELRRHGVRLLAIGGWICVAAIAVIAMVFKSPNGVGAILAGVTINLLPTLMAIAGRSDMRARVIVGAMVALHPALFVYLFEGHGWQMDLHMYFFVALSALAILCDWVPIAVAAGLIVLHHLSLELIAPLWVFDSTSILTGCWFMPWPWYCSSVCCRCSRGGWPRWSSIMRRRRL